MKPAQSLARFVAAPAGTFLLRRNYAVWCASRELFGATFWGVLSVEDAHEVCAAWELDRDFERYDTIIDASRLTRVDLPGFAVVAGYLAGRLDDYRRRVRKQVVLAPADEVNGTLV